MFRKVTRLALALTALAATFGLAVAPGQADPDGSKHGARPTVVLVHGAFAESASWASVIERLRRSGYSVVAPANPLRGLQSDAAYLQKLLTTIDGPLVLVGHSYGGAVITNAAMGNPRVKALVYVAAFAPARGETAVQLATRFPGGTLPETLAPVSLGDGSADLYIRQELFRKQFAGDVPAREAALMAATQRPIHDSALNEPSGDPGWATIPSWFVLAAADNNIPLAAQRFMAERAASRGTVEVAGASHAVPVSHPKVVADLIERAAAAR